MENLSSKFIYEYMNILYAFVSLHSWTCMCFCVCGPTCVQTRGGIRLILGGVIIYLLHMNIPHSFIYIWAVFKDKNECLKSRKKTH